MYSSVSSQCKTYGNLFSLAKTFVKIQYSVCVCNQILKMHCFYEISAKKCWESQCGNYGNLLTNFFGKNFVNITVLLERLRRDSFSKCIAFTKFLQKKLWNIFRNFHTALWSGNYHNFYTVKVFSRNISLVVRVNFSAD